MKTARVVVSDARSIEHAAEKALSQGHVVASACPTPKVVTKVKFITLELTADFGRGQTWSYIFEVELETV